MLNGNPTTAKYSFTFDELAFQPCVVKQQCCVLNIYLGRKEITFFLCEFT